MPAYVSLLEVRPMPDLENLKKEAKLYVRWHRDRCYRSPPKFERCCPASKSKRPGGPCAQLQALRRAGTDREEVRVR